MKQPRTSLYIAMKHVLLLFCPRAWPPTAIRPYLATLSLREKDYVALT